MSTQHPVTRAHVASSRQPKFAPDDHPAPAKLLAGEHWLQAGFALCALLFLACLLLTVTPLTRMPDPLFHLHFALGSWPGRASVWLPANLGPTYQPSSASIEFFCLVTLAFLFYSLAAFLLSRGIGSEQQKGVRLCLWLVLGLAGAIYAMTPAVLSHDAMVYAGYSRLLAAYHANPYFVVYSAYPRDPLVSLDQWAGVNSVYGPVWMFVCGLLGMFVNPSLEAYLLAFRLLALVMHILNTWLVDRTLAERGISRRVRTLGMLLYAWNPLVLLEGGLNGHNDIFMLTFVLLGAWLVARAERRGDLLRARGYLPPLCALTLAALVKFAILPVLAVYLLFLTCKVLLPVGTGSLAWKERLRVWRPGAFVLCRACLVALLLALACYGPFWVGHDVRAIMQSFTENPASRLAENSYQRSIVNWLPFHPAQQHNPILLFLSWRKVWDGINYLAVLVCLVLGVRWLWPKPTARRFVVLALAVMSLVLLLTPWFFSWYVTWLVGLTAVCLPARRERLSWSCVGLALTFSFSALSLYLFNHDLLGTRGYLVSLFDTLPPICAWLFCWWRYPRLRPHV